MLVCLASDAIQNLDHVSHILRNTLARQWCIFNWQNMGGADYGGGEGTKLLPSSQPCPLQCTVGVSNVLAHYDNKTLKLENEIGCIILFFAEGKRDSWGRRALLGIVYYPLISRAAE